jgi:hypothetical protein
MITNELYEAKYTLLGSEFDQYVLEHPDFATSIPNGALIIFLDETEPGFSKWSVTHAQQYLQIDDEANRPVVYVEVGQLMPRRSRMVRPRIVQDTRKYVSPLAA